MPKPGDEVPLESWVATVAQLTLRPRPPEAAEAPTVRGTAVRAPMADLRERETAVRAPTADLRERESAVRPPTADLRERESAARALTADLRERKSAARPLTADLRERKSAARALTADLHGDRRLPSAPRTFRRHPIAAACPNSGTSSRRYTLLDHTLRIASTEPAQELGRDLSAAGEQLEERAVEEWERAQREAR